MNKDHPTDSETKEPPTISAGDARQGEIILKRRWQRIVFIGGPLVVILILITLIRFVR